MRNAEDPAPAHSLPRGGKIHVDNTSTEQALVKGHARCLSSLQCLPPGTPDTSHIPTSCSVPHSLFLGFPCPLAFTWLWPVGGAVETF